MRQQYKALKSGDVFTLFDGSRHVYGMKTETGRAVNLRTGTHFDVFPTRKVEAAETIDRTFLPASRHGEPVFVRKLTTGKDDRFVCRSFLVTASDLVYRHELTLPEIGAEGSPVVDALLLEIEKLASKVAALAQAAKALNEPEPDALTMAEGYISSLMQSFYGDGNTISRLSQAE